jgi:hypothetical protein
MRPFNGFKFIYDVIFPTDQTALLGRRFSCRQLENVNITKSAQIPVLRWKNVIKSFNQIAEDLVKIDARASHGVDTGANCCAHRLREGVVPVRAPTIVPNILKRRTIGTTIVQSKK